MASLPQLASGATEPQPGESRTRRKPYPKDWNIPFSEYKGYVVVKDGKTLTCDSSAPHTCPGDTVAFAERTRPSEGLASRDNKVRTANPTVIFAGTACFFGGIIYAQQTSSTQHSNNWNAPYEDYYAEYTTVSGWATMGWEFRKLLKQRFWSMGFFTRAAVGFGGALYICGAAAGAGYVVFHAIAHAKRDFQRPRPVRSQ